MKNLINAIKTFFSSEVEECKCPIQSYLEDIDFKIDRVAYRRLIELLNEDPTGTVAIINPRGEYITLKTNFPIHVFERWVDRRGCDKRARL